MEPKCAGKQFKNSKNNITEPVTKTHDLLLSLRPQPLRTRNVPDMLARPQDKHLLSCPADLRTAVTYHFVKTAFYPGDSHFHTTIVSVKHITLSCTLLLYS